MNFIPTYKVIYKEYSYSKKSDVITLVNITNDFDAIQIKVSENVRDEVKYGSYYSIDTRTKRTWYTLWLGKKEEYNVFGNVNKEGCVMITTSELTEKVVKDFQRSEKWRGL